MTVRALDSNGDIVTSGVHFITERQEIAQTIQTRLRLFYGEYFRDITDGTNVFSDVFQKGVTSGAADAELRRRISQTEGVQGIISYESEFELSTRTLNVSCSVLTIYGDVEVNFNG